VTRLRPLDGIRGLAIAFVIAFHEVVEFAPGGAIGVDIFFALSSFLITQLLLTEVRRRGSIDFLDFYWRRICRLAPALVAFLVIVAPASSILVGRTGDILTSSLVTMAYVSDFAMAGLGDLHIGLVYGHTWSLAVEEQFYFAWPLLLLLVVRAGRFKWGFAIGAMLVSVALFTVSWQLLGQSATYFLPTGHLTALAAGVLAAVWLENPPARLEWVVSTAAAVGAVALLTGWAAFSAAVPLIPAARIACTTLLSLGMAAILVNISCHPKALVGRMLSLRPVVWLGERSYGMYLYGTAIHLATAAIPVRRSWAIVISLCLGLLVSAVSYGWLEQPLRSRGRAWMNRRRDEEVHA
jgi:peptidoglycan/LPS O-acetylase OafA/YrhL